MIKRIICLILCISICAGIALSLSSCGGKSDAFVIMTEELDGLFNPFFSTTAADGTIVSMTQIGMLGSKYQNGAVTVAFGDNEAVVTKDYESNYDADSDTTTYTFVIKNGIKYSDGEVLTIEDVIFNLYVYLDPAYTGSSTMYSTDIVGLKSYRTQKNVSDDSDDDDEITENATSLAKNRIDSLINLYYATASDKGQNDNIDVSISDMKEAISKWSGDSGYNDAISNEPLSEEELRAQLLKDYERTLEEFKKELETDYVSAQEAYDLTKEPYKSNLSYFNDPVFRFMCYEGLVSIEYEKDANHKDIKTKIKKITKQYSDSVCKDKASAVNYVYNSKVSSELDIILTYWATANTLLTDYTAKAKEIILYSNMDGEGSLNIPNISGIVSLGHSVESDDEIVVNGNTYVIAREHKPDGSPLNPDEYDVLQITINGVDPKAVWNFAFSVAPQHYYSKGYTVDIENDEFGVEFCSYDFMTDVIQKPEVTKIPVGAGAYKATNVNNADNPTANDFFNNNVVYFKANNNFQTVGSGLNNAKIEKVRYQVVSASNALNALSEGSVHYVTPQLTNDNLQKLDGDLKKKGISYRYTDQLGYGYIGINAGKVTDINLRRAIMTAMNTELSLAYYKSGSASRIYWPMSTVSWAYPTDANGKPDQDNGHTYPAIAFNDEDAKEAIRDYMQAAGVSAGDKELKIKFTIAGSNLTDHPTYNTFQKAAEILNDCGWEIEVVADTQALTKLSTGSLAVWAAAWGSTIDPDLYQVYHKNSTATSVLAWGYREILANPSYYYEEIDILNSLSDVIDDARETDDQEERTALYKEAMGYILDLAIELPVYQRSVLYAYNTEVINPDSLPDEINPYSSPLDRIWEIEFAE